MRIFGWAGELVCGFRTQNLGLRKLRPHVELQSPWTARERWQRSRNETSTQTGYETFVMLSALDWKR
jgi:hypothetical protein